MTARESILLPGFDAAKINAGIATAIQTIEAKGWQVDPCMIAPDETGVAEIERQLRGQRYDGVVIGAGLRLPPKSLALFARVVNAVHQAAPDAAARQIRSTQLPPKPTFTGLDHTV